MSDEASFKAACEQCGEHVEAPGSMRGAVIDCPHCGSMTQLHAAHGTFQPVPKSQAKQWPGDNKGYLNQLRANSRYTTLRTVISATVILVGLIPVTLLVASLTGLASQESAGPMVAQYQLASACVGLLGLVACAAIHQAANVVLDIADAVLDLAGNGRR